MSINWWQIIIELIGFALVTIIIFYKSFFKSLAKQYAKIATTEELQTIKDTISYEFKQKFAEYQSTLDKDNISYQIALAELTKLRFEKIEILIESLLDLQDYIKRNMFNAEYTEEYEENKQKFNNLYDIVNKNRMVSSMYLPDELNRKVENTLDSFYRAYLSFVKLYNTDPKRLGEIDPYDLDRIKVKSILSSQNFEAYIELNKNIDEFPKVMHELTNEIRKTITLRQI